MTEKRFVLEDEVIIDNNSIADDGGKQLYWTVEYVQRQKLVDLMNTLAEENEQLKQDGFYWAETAEARRKEIDKLRKDNSISKQQRDYLFDVIDEVLPHSGSTTVYNRMKNIGDVE